VSDNEGYEAESHAATMILQNKGTQQRQKTIFINTYHEEATQLLKDHNGVPQLHIMSRRAYTRRRLRDRGRS